MILIDFPFGPSEMVLREVLRTVGKDPGQIDRTGIFTMSSTAATSRVTNDSP
jgi:hypothetical protein